MNEVRFADLREGLTAGFSVAVTDDRMRAFEKLSGDTNPLHTSEEFARSQGFPGKVVYGLLHASFYSTLVGVHLPGRYALLHGANISFLKPVFVGDVLEVKGTITYLNESHRQIEISAEILNGKNELVSRAKIKAGCLDAAG